MQTISRFLYITLCCLWLFGCDTVELSATSSGFADDTVDIMIRPLGTLSESEVKTWSQETDVERTLRLPKGSCKKKCRFALLTVYVENIGNTPLAPPVVRLDVPKNRNPRGALAFGTQEISPGRKGRLRWLVELWPEEKTLSADISSSVFLTFTNPQPKETDAEKAARLGSNHPKNVEKVPVTTEILPDP